MASAHSALSFSQLAARLRTGPSAGMRESDSAFGLSATTSDAYATVAPVDPGLLAIGLSILRRRRRGIHVATIPLLVLCSLPKLFW